MPARRVLEAIVSVIVNILVRVSHSQPVLHDL